MPRIPILLLALGLAVSAAAGLEREPDASESGAPPTIVEEVVVTATTSEVPSRRSPVPTQVISRDQIEALATADVETVLEAVPGILVVRNTAFSLGATTVSLQGAAPDQVAILVDGRPFIGGIDGVADLRDIPVNNIERIEIVRGPGSALYGSNAMAGVINIITRAGSETTGGEVSVAAGSFDNRLLKAASGGALGRARYFVSGQGGSYKPAQQWGDAFSVQLGPEDRQDRTQGFVRVDVPLETHELQLAASYLKEENPQSYNRDPSLHAHWLKRFEAGSSLRLSLDSHGYFRRNEFPGLEEVRNYDDQRAEARYKHAFLGDRAWKNHLITGGYRLRREALESPVLSEPSGPLVPEPVDAEVSQHTLYIQDEVFVGERWSATAAVGFDDHERYGGEASPRIGIAWTPGRRDSVSVSWGEGYRAPTLLQLYDKDINIIAPGSPNPGYQIVGNTGLRPETNEAWNVQYDHGGSVVRGFVSAHRARYEDLITTQLAGFNPLTFQYVNVAGARISGVDASLELDVTKLAGIAAPHRLDASLSFSYLDTESRSPLPTEDGRQLPFRPQRTWTPMLRYGHDRTGTRVSVWGNHASDQYTALTNVDVIESHWLVNLKVTQRIFRALELFVQGTNVTDTQQSAHSTLSPDPPVVPLLIPARAYLAGLTYRFGGPGAP